MKLKFTISTILFFMFTTTFLVSCGDKTKQDFDVKGLIPVKSDRDRLLLDLVTIIEEHIPDTVLRANRFEVQYKPFFLSIVNKFDFECLYKNSDEEYFYFIRKPAYGVEGLFVGLGGKFKLDKNGKVKDFEESYRMFRMPDDELNKKGMAVYTDFIEGKDLSKFHKDINVDPYIEFPNEHVAYNKKTLEWYITKPY